MVGMSACVTGWTTSMVSVYSAVLSTICKEQEVLEQENGQSLARGSSANVTSGVSLRLPYSAILQCMDEITFTVHD